MKLRLDLHGVIFEYEKHPMKPDRFRALFILGMLSLYAWMVIGVAEKCGVLGVFEVAVVTLILSILNGE